jgi:P-type Ca2+ transporter type 2C
MSSNIGEVLTMLLGVVFAAGLGLQNTGEALAVPLLATQILWINLRRRHWRWESTRHPRT